MELFDFIRKSILDTFPDPHFDDHEEELLRERDEMRDKKVMIINKIKKED